MDASQLIRLLADGQPHHLESVEARVVEEAVAALQSGGISVQYHGDALQLEKPIDLLCDRTIVSALQPQTRQQLHDLHLHSVTDSTNVQAMQGIEQGRKHGHVYLAEQQTAGRGRRGREWVSPLAGNIYLSLVWQFNAAGQDISSLSLVVGVAVCRALTRLGVSDTSLKWPNDVLANGKKLGGILLEMQGDPSRECQVVIGIGLNVNMAQHSAAAISQPWVDIASLCSADTPPRNIIVAALLDALVEVLAEFKAQGFARLHGQWQALDAYADAEVMLQLGEDYVFGIARGVNQQGALRLETASGEQIYHGGEVSLRPMGLL